MHCLTCPMSWTPECLTAVCDAILETEIFCRLSSEHPRLTNGGIIFEVLEPRPMSYMITIPKRYNQSQTDLPTLP